MKIIILAILVIFAVSLSLHEAAETKPAKGQHGVLRKLIKACRTSKLSGKICQELIALKVGTIDTKKILNFVLANCIKAKKEFKKQCDLFEQQIFEVTDAHKIAQSVKAACKGGKISAGSCQALQKHYDSIKPGERVQTIGASCVSGKIADSACGELFLSGAVKLNSDKIFFDGLKKCLTAFKKDTAGKTERATCFRLNRLIEQASPSDKKEIDILAAECDKKELSKATCKALADL